MTAKIGPAHSREALADFLADLARQLRQGEVSWVGTTVPLPPTGDLTWEIKAKGGELKLKLTLAFAVPASPPAPAAAARTAAFKAVKERLEGLFALLVICAAGGYIPPAALVGEFKELSEQLAAQAEPERRPEAEKYLAHVANLVQAVDLQDLQRLRHELAELQFSLT